MMLYHSCLKKQSENRVLFFKKPLHTIKIGPFLFTDVNYHLVLDEFYCRSLAYNNLETLPKDLFKGMEALTKVYVCECVMF